MGWPVSCALPSLSWFAATGTGFGVHLAFGPFTLDGSGVGFACNTTSAATPITDWSFAGGPTLPANYFHLEATGGVTVSLSPFASLSATGFSLTRQVGKIGPTGTGTLFVLTLNETYTG